MHSSKNEGKSHQEICSKGGRTTVRRMGKKHMRELGRKGAESMLKKYGKDHMKKLAKLSHKKRRKDKES